MNTLDAETKTHGGQSLLTDGFDHTPRTDAQAGYGWWVTRSHPAVPANFARELERENARLIAALTELVTCKNLKDKADRGVTTAGNAAERGMCASFKEAADTLEEYNRRKPLAWQRARELVGSNVSSTAQTLHNNNPESSEV